ncbi:metal ABC transporter permease [Luteolibacter sp. AS25]|uniref:metal ABC transporter permease n=1 Tax=Luteolibacter sp. AS25 TaxID=3135776 RepID=UPI00398B2D7E
MMEWLIGPLGYEHIQRGLLICILVGFTNGYFSAFVVLRKSALQVGSLSHSLLPGIGVGILLFGLSQASAFAGALFAALIVGLGSLLVARSSRLGQETALAILFTTAFAGGLLLLEFAPVHVDIDHYLFGNILFATDADLMTVFWVSAVSLVMLTVLRRPMILMLFEPDAARALGVPVRLLNYLLFGLLILVLISTLQAVGCLLALGLLVTPAATVYLLTDRPEALFWGGGLIGSIAAVVALILSHHLNFSPGSTIILTLGGIFTMAFLLSPRHGIFSRIMGTSKV